jgi:predicted membrane protein
MELDDIKSTLPSCDNIWEDPGLSTLGKAIPSEITLLKALETVYMEKKMPHNLGEFSSALLINAIYRNTQKIMLRKQNALNSWTPTAAAHGFRDGCLLSKQHLWPSTDPMIANWRNSACDCLDVLHWQANSKAARFSGSEHHLILHLHLARLIILTPTEYIQTLSTTKSTSYQGSSRSRSSMAISAHHQILQWTIRDRYKARLSIIHCGALFWHVRRYSRNSILEPYAIYIATLVLWAYCTMMQFPEVIEAAAQDCEDDPEPRFLHLDRPLDDELVQSFVRNGHKISAHMSKVGNILDRGAPTKILEEGLLLLTGGSRIVGLAENGPFAMDHTWGIENLTRNYFEISSWQHQYPTGISNPRG